MEEKSPSNKHALLILFSVIVLDLIGFGVVIPILPFYAEGFGANATVLGILLSSYAVMQFLFAPFWGKLSDRIGRKQVLLITILGSCLGLTILGLAKSLVLLFIGRIVSGIFAANIGVASAYVTDVTDDSNRAKGMGMIGAAFGIGFILGPTIGGLLSKWGYSTPILFAAGLCMLNFLYTFLRLAEPMHPAHPRIPKPKIGALLRDPFVRRFCIINLFFTLGLSQLESVFAFFMKDRFKYDAQHVAYILAAMALIMVAIQGGMIKRLVTRFGEKSLLLTGVVILAIAFCLVPSAHLVLWLLIPLCLSSIGRGISYPSMLSLVSKGGNAEIKGSVMGVFQASASLARAFGPALAGMLYDASQGYPFYLAGISMAIVLLLSLGISPTHSIESRIPELDAAVS